MPLYGRASGAPDIVLYDNMNPGTGPAAVGSQSIMFNSLFIAPLTPNFVFPGNMTVSTMLFDLSHASLTATASSSSFTSSFQFGFYTANSTQLNLVNSVQTTYAKAAATANTTLFSGGGPRWVTIHSSLWSSTPYFTPAQYYVGWLARSSNFAVPGSSVGLFLEHTSQRMGTWGSSTATNTGIGWYPGMGVWSVSQTAIPTSIAASGINQAGTAANFVPHIMFNAMVSSF